MSVFLLSDKKPESLVIFVDEAKSMLSKIKDSEIHPCVQAVLKHDFKGKFKESYVAYPASGSVKRLILVGTGPQTKLSLQMIRTLAAHSISCLRNAAPTKNVGFALPSVKKWTPAEISQALQEGSEISQLNYFEFKTDRKPEEKHRYEKISPQIYVLDRKDMKAAALGFERGSVIGEGVNWGRHLIMTPGSHLNPEVLAKEAQKMAASSPSKAKIKTMVWTEKDLQKNKFGGVLGVGQGSTNPPRFIILEYSGGKKGDAPIVLVGKGITFDSGGLSLKPPASMETMKYDMAGSASVLSAFRIIAGLGVKVNLVALVPSAENMPSGSAIRPGDVLHMASGKTVEVLNTDAEGRLILADALFWASTQYKPRCIIDVATLTGACALAVGDAAVGVFSNSKKLMSAVVKSSEETSENVWALPNFPEVYGPMIKSDIADIKNTGGRTAGASTASMFLQHFVHNDTPWAHFDIAGCGWYEGPRDFIMQRGSSGIPIRLLADFVEQNAASKFN